VDKLFAFRRLTPPHTSKVVRMDTQTYMYFMENQEEEHIKLNESELTESKWLNPRQAVESIKMFFPQQMSLIWLSQIRDYSSLKSMFTDHLDKMMSSYLEFRGNVFVNNSKLIPEDSKFKTLEDYYQFIFNKNDFMSDAERKQKHGLIVLSQDNHFNEFTGAKEVTELLSDSGSAIFDHHECECKYHKMILNTINICFNLT